MISEPYRSESCDVNSDRLLLPSIIYCDYQAPRCPPRGQESQQKENNLTREIDAAGESRPSVMRRTTKGGGGLLLMTNCLSIFQHHLRFKKISYLYMYL